MRRRRLAPLLIASALALASTGRLAAQGPDAAADQKENGRWHAVKDKGLSLLAPTLEKAQSNIQELLRELNQKYLPAAREAGYEVAEIRITVGIPTVLTLQVKRLERVDQAKQRELLEKYHDDPVTRKIVETLFAANEIKVEGYEAKEVHLSLGFPPNTTLVLTPIEEDGEDLE